MSLLSIVVTGSGGSPRPVGAPIPIGLIQNVHVGGPPGASPGVSAATAAAASSGRGAATSSAASASRGAPFQRQRMPVPVPMQRGAIGPLVSTSESPPKSIRLSAPSAVNSMLVSRNLRSTITSSGLTGFCV